jgi:hypothetical protein
MNRTIKQSIDDLKSKVNSIDCSATGNASSSATITAFMPVAKIKAGILGVKINAQVIKANLVGIKQTKQEV